MATLKDNLSALLQRVSMALAQLSESDISKLLDDGYNINKACARAK